MTSTRPERLLIAGAAAVVAWWFLLRGAGMPPAMPGMREPASLATLVVMWAAMMAAMMIPGAVPGIARRGTAYGAGFVLVWVAFGAAAAVLQWELDRAGALSETMALRTVPLAALVVAAAGLYELGPLKAACLRRCRTELEGDGDAIPAAFAGGLREGTFCIGCCWALMALLFVAGVMNLAAMAALALLVAVEKIVPLRLHVSRIAGVALIAGAALFVTLS
jgi:predicted metal-binding membrane protein